MSAAKLARITFRPTTREQYREPNITECHGLGTATDIADAMQRIKQSELALKRTEEMIAENMARCSRIRRLVAAADRSAKHRAG